MSTQNIKVQCRRDSCKYCLHLFFVRQKREKKTVFVLHQKINFPDQSKSCHLPLDFFSKRFSSCKMISLLQLTDFKQLKIRKNVTFH